MPGVPYSGNTHNRFVSKMDIEWMFSVAILFPFEEPAQWNDAALTADEISIEPALEHRLASRIDRRQLRRERRLCARHQLPAHLLELSISIDRPHGGRNLCWAQVVNRRQSKWRQEL